MKVLACLFFVIGFAGCSHQQKPAAEPKKMDFTKKSVVAPNFHKFRLNNDYTVIDTGEYTNDGPMTGGSYAIIQRNGTITDTIDLSLGMKDLGNGTYLYQTLNPDSDNGIQHSTKTLVLAQGDYMMVKNGLKSRLKDILPDFDGYFSSPNAINGNIYYWQLKQVDTLGAEKVSAAYYDPLTKLTKNRYLTNTVLETDDSYYFSLPYLEKDSVVYEMERNKKWKLSGRFNTN